MPTPATLRKAYGAAQRIQWLLARVAKSRLPSGPSRESVEKFMLHYWHVEGQQRCESAMEAVRAIEGQRASTDHTYHVVSNLAAKSEEGRFVALKASLTSVMGQSHVLGCKASPACFQAVCASIMHACMPSLKHACHERISWSFPFCTRSTLVHMPTTTKAYVLC